MKNICFPMAEAQQGIWMSQEHLEDSAIYGVSEKITLSGDINPAIWQQAANKVLASLPALRSHLVRGDGDFPQIALGKPILAEFLDLRRSNNPDKELESWIKKANNSPIDCFQHLVSHAALIQTADQRFCWFLRIHHVVCDGFGFSLISNHLEKTYQALLKGQDPSLDIDQETQKFQQALQDLVSSSSKESQSYWESKTPLSEIRPIIPTPERQKNIRLAVGSYAKPIHPARLVLATALLAQAINRKDEVVLGVHMMARNTQALLSSVCTAQNELPLLVNLSADATVAEAMENITASWKEMSQHQLYRHERIRRDRALAAYQPLTDIALNIVPFNKKLNLESAQGIVAPVWDGPTDVLTIDVRAKTSQEHEIALVIGDPNFDRQTLDAYASAFNTLYRALLARSEEADARELRSIPLTSQIQPVTEPIKELTHLSTFLANFADEENVLVTAERTMTGAEVKQNILALSRLLGERTKHQKKIMFLLPRNEWAILAPLAALYSGHTFIPCDIQWPVERIHTVVNQAQPDILLTMQGLAQKYFQHGILAMVGVVVSLDDQHIQQALANYAQQKSAIPVCYSPDDIAYLLFTSGTTGVPKGVMVRYRNMENYLRTVADIYVPRMHDASGKENLHRFIHEHPFAFDASISPLAYFMLGTALYVPDEETLKDPRAHVDYLRTHDIDGMDISPAVFQELLYAGFELAEDRGGLTTVALGGDKCPQDLWTYFKERPHINALNTYGPTENTVEATFAVIAETDEPTIGSSLPGQYALVTTSWGQICPAYFAGELWLGGESVAAGYFKLPEETAAKFLETKYGYIYRSGDLVATENNGKYRIFGRIDSQLSLNGVRIESQEIEHALLAQPQVRQATTMIRDDGRGERLIGYIVSEESALKADDIAKMRQRLYDFLPASYVPAALVALPAMPLTDRGKIDFQALPAPENMSIGGRFFEQMSTEERHVATIYADVVSADIRQLTSETDLFSLGGHSLSAMRVMSQLRDLGYETLTLKDLFTDSKISSIAQHCTGENRAEKNYQLESSHDSLNPDITEITDAQRRMWFIEKAEGSSALYTIPLIFDVDSSCFDKNLCERALKDLVAHYPTLSSFYRADQSGALYLQQVAADDIDRLLTIQPVEHVQDAREHLQTLETVIDPANELPIKVFVSHSTEQSRLILLFHHMAVDGWALSVFIRVFSLAYQHRLEGKALAQVPSSSNPAVAKISEEDLDWWKEQTRSMPASLELPSDRARPTKRNHLGDEVRLELGADLTQGLKQVGKKLGATPFMLFQAITAMLLSKCGAGEDLPLGTIMANRASFLEENAMTFAANTVLTRLDTSGNPSFEEMILRIRNNTADLLAHSHVPFDSVVSTVNPARSSSYHPLFQVLIIEQNIDQETCEFSAGHQVAPYIVGTGTAKFDLTFEFSTLAGGTDAETVELRLEYATDIFDSATAHRLMNWFHNLAKAVVEHPDTRLWEHSLETDALIHTLSEAERMLRYRFNRCELNQTQGTATDSVPAEHSMSEHLEDIFATAAERVALVEITEEGVRQEITYHRLEQISATIRDHLWANGLGVGDRVALLLPRSSYQVAAILGALRAGVTYVPLDPHYPVARLNLILQDAAVSAVLFQNTEVLADLNQEYLGNAKLLDLDLLEPIHQSIVSSSIPADTPAYIIFTSGSTGRPKGVVVPQKNVMRLLSSTDDWFHFGENDTWTLFHSYAFDFAVWEMFGALLTGGKLVIVPHSISRSPQEFGSLLVREKITILNQTPSAFGQLVIADESQKYDFSSLRAVVLGGEAMDLPMVHRWQKLHPSAKCQVINMYGITETTVHVTYQEITEETTGISPVGQPIPDLSVYLLDEGGKPVPNGIVGEIYVGGAGLALEYLGRKELTAERFIPDPYAQHILATCEDFKQHYSAENPRMYKSGDLAVRLPNGTLDFKGRADRQVQLRGFRIELGELESLASTYEGVQDSFARVVGKSESDKRLLLYVVCSQPENADSQAFRHYLSARLPQYMVPAMILFLEKMPLTVNGKLDTDALPLPLVKSSGGRAPQTLLERQLHECFTEVLDLEHCSAEDSFFDLGGHSMLAVELVIAIEKVTGQKIRVGTVMRSPSIELLADALERDTESAQEDLQVLIPLQRSEGSASGAIYCLHPAGGLSWCYSSLTKYIPADIPVWGVQARGVLTPDLQPRSLAEMATDYLQEILRVHGEGPIHIIGWSLGGMVAQVLATQIKESGLKLGAVALLDAYPSEAETGVGEPPLEDAVSSILAMSGLEDEVLCGDFNVPALHRALQENLSPMAGLPAEVIEALTKTYQNTAKILREYAHSQLESTVLFFQATRAGVGPDHDPREWEPYIKGELRIHEIDCTHREMTQAAPIAVIAPLLLKEILNDAE